MHLHRRHFLLGLAASLHPSLHAADAEGAADTTALLRAGGMAVLLRHAQTVPGTGDPEGFRLGDCATQRNLSDAGRAQARALGDWFRARKLTPQAVRSSAWCRCIDTAQLAFGSHAVWPVLNSFFAGLGEAEAQTRELRAALKGLKPGAFEVWVTHQVNITALTDVVPAMGEAVIVDAQGRIRARTLFR